MSVNLTMKRNTVFKKRFKCAPKCSTLALTALLPILSLHVQAEEPTLKLNTTIKGNIEQPKVLYIMPWQAKTPSKVDLNEAFTPNLTTLIAPIEGEQFDEEVEYRRSQFMNSDRQNHNELDDKQ